MSANSKIERVLAWIARRRPTKVIGGECFHIRGPLMTRHLICRTPWFSVYLHHFLRSDYDRACHDHPWSFMSLILTSGYTEHTINGSRRFGPGSVLVRPAEWLHWVEIQKPAWTLVVVGRKRREWGFLSSSKGWQGWQEFEADGGCD